MVRRRTDAPPGGGPPDARDDDVVRPCVGGSEPRGSREPEGRPQSPARAFAYMSEPGVVRDSPVSSSVLRPERIIGQPP
jgi:hypothetical protein